MFELYGTPFLMAFFLGVILLALTLAFLGKYSFGRIKERHLHKKNVSRLGGVALIFSFAGTLFWMEKLVFSQRLWAIVFVLLAILIFGIWDDFQELHWKTQLFFQISVVMFAYIMGVRIDYVSNPFGGVFLLNSPQLIFIAFLLVVLWVALIMNSINWVDGVDGLSGGITLIGMGVIFVLSLKPEVNQPPVGIITAAMMGSVLAFLIFNFNPARIFAGTGGSMFMGFMLSVLAIFAGAKIATTLLVIAIPVIDAIWVIFQRIKFGKSVFEADNFHLHHKLSVLGWSHQKICWFFYALTGTVGFIALNTGVFGKVMTMAILLVMMGIIFFWVQRKIEKLTEMKKISYAKK